MEIIIFMMGFFSQACLVIEQYIRLGDQGFLMFEREDLCGRSGGCLTPLIVVLIVLCCIFHIVEINGNY